jgi:MFS family permease
MRQARPSLFAQALHRRELLPWGLSGFTLALVEGATAAVLVKRGFTGLASPWAVNLAVAFVSGAPAMSNMASFIWANLAHGREKVRLVVLLLALFGLLVGMVGLWPRAGVGLAATVLSVIAARVVWAGIVVVRSAIWTANYPRAVLAQITSRIVIVTALGAAIAATLAGIVLQTHPLLARWLFPAAALSSLMAALLYQRMRVRQSWRLRAAELDAGSRDQAFSLRSVRDVLDHDPQYRRFMTAHSWW